MSEDTLKQVLDRLQNDSEFQSRLRQDWEAALGELDLSHAELVALATQDEDSLRRLARVDLAPGGLGFLGTDFICSWLCTVVWTTVPVDTNGSTRDTCPGSKGHCGTGGGDSWCVCDDPV